MKISLSTSCKECREEAHSKDQKYINVEPFTLVELNEKGVYKLTCPNGHVKWYFIEEQLFQILYDLGALSLSDGYTREAVSSFSTALERFYEFIIKFILLKRNISENDISQYLRYINRQSERQLGGFAALYIIEFNTFPPVLDNKWIRFRNEVVHLGTIPNETKTFAYGQIVANIIFDILIELKKKYKNRINTLINRVSNYNYQLAKQKNQINEKINILSLPRMIQLRIVNEEYFDRIDLRKEVNKYKRDDDLKRITYFH